LTIGGPTERCGTTEPPIAIMRGLHEAGLSGHARSSYEQTVTFQRRSTIVASLPTRKFGRSGPGITPIGFGAWAIGGGGWAFGWGPQDDAASLAAMRRALESGINWPDGTGVPVEQSWEEMGKLVKEGKVRWAGVSNFDVSLLDRCRKLAHVDSLQPPFSMIHREAAAAEIPWCAGRGTGVIVYSPMVSGILNGKWTADRLNRLAPDDWRRRSPDFRRPNVERNLALRDALRPVAKRRGTTVEAVATAWTLCWPGVTDAIVGARSPEQVDGWIGAAGLTLSGEDLDEIAGAIARTGAGSGPKHPGGEAGSER
jgi:aryl-alcohol dehydrogenase-like predicted oxidoreductase